MDYKITVTIPCHNSESTIKRCINSVINQTIGFENIELILYDNASSDSTRKIIQDYANKFDNIRIFFSDTDSGFPGTSRNKGIQEASSKYIMFIDSDDEYDPNICELYYNEMESTNVDVITCKFNNIDDVNNRFIKNDEKSLEKIRIDKDVLYFNEFMIWNKIYKKSILKENNLLFPDDSYGEDFYFCKLYLLHCNSLILFSNYYGYNRFVQIESKSRNWELSELTEILNLNQKMYNELLEYHNIDYSRLYREQIQSYIYKLYSLNILNNKSEIIEFLKKLSEFELNIGFDENLGMIQNMANKLILKKKFNSCYYYLKCVKKIYDSKRLRGIYRFF